MERYILRISEVLYVGLCNIIGTPSQVKIRRDVTDAMEVIKSPLHIRKGYRMMTSGSVREGFRLPTSDVDFMIWFTKDLVVCDLSQVPLFHPIQNLILMECQDTPPGFAKLRLIISPNQDKIIRQSCVRVNDRMYISNSLYRDLIQGMTQSHPMYQSSTPHGPCSSGFIGSVEYDNAHCFSCKHWPPPACQWMERCRRQGWPSPNVLQEIISDGYHFVAISSVRSSSLQECETEWRMSFSNAEYKLVQSMNHTQFLCYGLLKIFLKEVLNVDMENHLLCSYFMKTTLFWKIQESTIFMWSSQNILHCTWLCFKYLTQCVYKGEFPNFFIPQNNMFMNKIHGAAQKQLFLQLLNLYNMGFSCLLLSPSLYEILQKAILNPWLQVSNDEKSIMSEVDIELELFREIGQQMDALFVTEVDDCCAFLKTIDDVYKTIPPNSQNQIITLCMIRNSIVIQTAFGLDKTRGENAHNTKSSPLEMLISAKASGCITDTLYVALYLYNKGHYIMALHYVDKTKQNLSQPYVFDVFTRSVNTEKYVELLGGQSLLDRFRKAVSCYIVLNKHCAVEELRLELFVGHGFMNVPPLVMTHMLSFLCHHHQGYGLKSSNHYMTYKHWCTLTMDNIYINTIEIYHGRY